MKIWLDTSNIQTIHRALRLGVLCGVTTNPNIVAKSGRAPEEIIEELLHHQEGPITFQVVSDNTPEMVQEALNLHSISKRIIIKVPVTQSGFETIHLLARRGIQTMATTVFTPHQALMAALAGADYVAPYLNRIETAGGDPWVVLKSISMMFGNYQLPTKILGASLINVDQVIKCAEIGIHAVTLKDDVFNKLFENHPLTAHWVNQFSQDWEKINNLATTAS